MRRAASGDGAYAAVVLLMVGGNSWGKTASTRKQEDEGASAERVGRAFLPWTPYDILRRSRGAIWDLLPYHSWRRAPANVLIGAARLSAGRASSRA